MYNKDIWQVHFKLSLQWKQDGFQDGDQKVYSHMNKLLCIFKVHENRLCNLQQHVLFMEIPQYIYKICLLKIL